MIGRRKTPDERAAQHIGWNNRYTARAIRALNTEIIETFSPKKLMMTDCRDGLIYAISHPDEEQKLGKNEPFYSKATYFSKSH